MKSETNKTKGSQKPQAGLGSLSPWQERRSQIYRSGDKFLSRMAKLAAEKDPKGIPKSHRQAVRPSADAIFADVAKVFGVKPEEAKNRARQIAFQNLGVSAAPRSQSESA